MNRSAMAMRFAVTLLIAAATVQGTSAALALTDAEVRQVVTEEVRNRLQAEEGAAVAVRIDGRTLFFNFGLADRRRRRPVKSDSLFNLASVSKVFDATLLALAVQEGVLAYDDPAANYIAELRHGRDIRNVTLGHLVTFTSGFSVPQDHPPWPPEHYTWRKFVRHVNAWTIGEGRRPGAQYEYSHAGILLLHVALARRYDVSYAALLERRLLRRLGLASTLLPRRGVGDDGRLPERLKRRAVQGYSGKGKPIGRPGNVQGYYHWPDSVQMYSSARDMAVFLAAQLEEQPHDRLLRDAIEMTHRATVKIPDRDGDVTQAHAWERHQRALLIVDKNGGLNNVTTYIGMIPSRRIGAVILINRGELNGRDFGHPLLLRLALPNRAQP